MGQDQLSASAVELLETQPSVLIRVAARPMTQPELLSALANYGFEARISFGVREDVVIATIPGFGLVTCGTDVDSALDDLRKELVDYAQDYFTDFAFYQQTSRVSHLPWLLRFALTNPAERIGLLTQEPSADTILPVA